MWHVSFQKNSRRRDSKFLVLLWGRPKLCVRFCNNNNYMSMREGHLAISRCAVFEDLNGHPDLLSITLEAPSMFNHSIYVLTFEDGCFYSRLARNQTSYPHWPHSACVGPLLYNGFIQRQIQPDSSRPARPSYFFLVPFYSKLKG